MVTQSKLVLPKVTARFPIDESSGVGSQNAMFCAFEEIDGESWHARISPNKLKRSGATGSIAGGVLVVHPEEA